MIEFDSSEIESLSMVIRSLQESNKIDFTEYEAYIPLKILEIARSVKTIKEYEEDHSIAAAELSELINLLRKAKKCIRYSSANPIRCIRSSKIKDADQFRALWDKIVIANKHVEVLDLMATRKRDSLPPYFQINNPISELIVTRIITMNKVSDDFINFVTEGNGRRYLSVPSKKKIVNYLYAKNRLQDMYRFSNAGSKTVNDLVISLANINDLPFLMDTDGLTASRRLERRINRME
jgi:hypothetical protein